MLLKVITFFLLFMAVLGIFGKWRNKLLGKPTDRKALGRPRKCEKCGRFLIGGGPCNCGKKG